MLLSLIALSALFVAAGFFNQVFVEHEREIAQDWYRRGEEELKAGRAEAALDPLRTALVYSRNKPDYELRLGQALVEAQHYAEAKTYLLTLWQRQPGSAELNLELARLAAREGNVSDAIHDYEASLYGVWESNGEQQRRAARRELIQYLLTHGRTAEAVAHTMSYAANLPPDPELHVHAGEMFLMEESNDHAAEQFREVLAVAPHNAAALAGAGRAAFALGDYAGAENYLERANRAEPGDKTVMDTLAVARAVRSLDPNAAELSARARGERAMHGFTLVRGRLAACGVPGNASAAAALAAVSARGKDLEPKLRRNQLARDLDLFSTTVNFVFDAERAATAACGPGSVDDRALMLLAARRPGGGQ